MQKAITQYNPASSSRSLPTLFFRILRKSYWTLRHSIIHYNIWSISLNLFLFSWLVWLYQCWWSNPKWYGSHISLTNLEKVQTICKFRRIYCKRKCQKVCLFGWKGLRFPAIIYKWLRCRRCKITHCSNSFGLPLGKRTLDSSWYHQWSTLEIACHERTEIVTVNHSVIYLYTEVPSISSSVNNLALLPDKCKNGSILLNQNALWTFIV